LLVTTQQSVTGLGVPCITDAEFTRFRGLILKQTGIHLKDNKRHLLVARLSRHVRELGLDNFSSYYEHLSRDTSGDELRNLTNLITTNKTSFFREPHHFELLRSHLIPEVRRRGDKTLRIWSAGCSSGEEPYSIAITVREALGSLDGWDVRILASDIDTEMLEHAQCGRYATESLEGISIEQRRAHFLRGYGQYEGLAQVRPELRKMIEFRRINFSHREWDVPSRFDAIFCRNVIIYFDRPLQERIIQRFTGHLKPGGYFFQGHSENLQAHRNLMVPVGTTAYRLKDTCRLIDKGGER
jgi:chemotaxis protein methyltransferase CheR